MPSPSPARLPTFLTGAALLASCAAPQNSFGQPDVEPDRHRLPSRIAFGSCADQDRPQPILAHVVERDPDLFIYLGDNIYGDTQDMDALRASYQTLADKPEFQALRSHCPTLAVWDDHDYGADDAGRHYPMKVESRAIFLDFWGVPLGSARRGHDGIYHEYVFSENDRTVQLLLLDTRTFRDDIVPNGSIIMEPHKNAYRPNLNPAATILGTAQWSWLEERLREPADLRVIATSIQFGHTYNGWESWTLVPHERDRLIDLVTLTRANGIVFISGDVHWGEISRQDVEDGYPLYDVTASGINKDWDVIEPNGRRVGPPVAHYNFGAIEIDWSLDDPTLELLSIDDEGLVRNRVKLSLSDLRFDD